MTDSVGGATLSHMNVRRSHGRRTEIGHWRVKDGNRDVYTGKKGDCVTWMRKNKSTDGGQLRLIPPNK